MRDQGVTPVDLDTLLRTSRLIYVLAVPSASNRALLESGEVVGLGLAAAKRSKHLPDLPTMAEQGVPLEYALVRGIMAPKGTPDSAITMLAKNMPAMFNDKKVIAKMQEGGSPVRVMTREQVQAMWKERQAYLAELLKDLRKE